MQLRLTLPALLENVLVHRGRLESTKCFEVVRIYYFLEACSLHGLLRIFEKEIPQCGPQDCALEHHLAKCSSC